LPAVDVRLDRGGEVAAFIHDPANSFADRGRRKEACTKGGVGACTADDVVD